MLFQTLVGNCAGKSAMTPTKEQRNEKGQWASGVSGNARGRPRKPRSLRASFRQALSEEIAVVEARGKRRMVPAHVAAIQHLVRSLPEMKPNELLKALQFMKELKVFGAESREGRGQGYCMSPEERAAALSRLISDAIAKREEKALEQREAEERSAPF